MTASSSGSPKWIVETADNTLYLAGGATIGHDVVVVATGALLLPEETEGLAGPGWEENVFTFYTLEGAIALRDALRRFDRGRLVVNMVDMPIKCPSRRWSSAFWPTGTCANAASAMTSSSSTPRR